MKVAIIGGRDFHQKEFLFEKVLSIVQNNKVSMIISGGAKGADTLAKHFALDHEIPFQEYLPQYHLFPGKIAPLKRNEQIVNACDILVAFPCSNSKGTLHAISLAKKQNKEIYIFKC